MPDPQKTSQLLLPLILLAVAVWGTLHAVGAYRYGRDPRAGFVVLGCTAAFLGFWVALLVFRSVRQSRRPPPKN